MGLQVIVAADLSHFEYRVLSLIAAKAYYEPAILSHSQIARTFGCSERQAIRATSRLIQREYITSRKRLHYPNTYALNPELFAVRPPSSLGDPCLKCGTPTRKLGAAGWCTKCVRLVDSERKPASKAIA